MTELQGELQAVTGTTLDATGAANLWAGTTGLELVGALNAKAGTVGLELNGVVKELARQFAGDPSLDSNAALSTDVGGGGLGIGGYATGYREGY